MYRPSELKLFLEGLGIRPKKGMSQNFLIDGNIVRKIVATADVAAEDIVLEIGPGPGALTQALLEKGATVIAVEMDPVLAKALERFNQTYEDRLHIVCSDILKVAVAEVLRPFIATGKKAKVIANLPYHVTTPILTRLAPCCALFESITVMVQKEVAERMTAAPGGRDYSSLTVFLGFYAEVRYCFTVGKNCFLPPPKVDSAVVQLQLRPEKRVSNREAFFQMTRTAFEHRRKMLRASLKDLYPPDAITEALTALSLNPQARPEELSLDQLLQLFEALQSIH